MKSKYMRCRFKINKNSYDTINHTVSKKIILIQVNLISTKFNQIVHIRVCSKEFQWKIHIIYVTKSYITHNIIYTNIHNSHSQTKKRTNYSFYRVWHACKMKHMYGTYLRNKNANEKQNENNK